MTNSSVADMLARITNAQLRRYDVVVAPRSKIVEAVAEILKKENFIAGYELIEDEDAPHKKNITINLKYIQGRPGISHTKIYSKPGRRKYIGYREIRKVLNGLGISILSTSKGILTGKDAREQRVGGEYICEIA